MSLDFLKDVAEFKEFVRALERFREERPRLSLSGVNDAARPYFLAMLAIHAPARTRTHTARLPRSRRTA